MAYYSNENAVGAWADINMTGTAVLNDSYNCSSVTDHAEGDNTLYFDTDFAGTNYCAVQHSENNEGSNTDSGNVASCYRDPYRTAGSMRFANMRLRFDAQPPQFKDSTHCSWAIFGDLS
tara:strand:+ start:460 stop:816 length:357 start_codon:yes stop_codon:yes gene_type:complete